METKHYFNKHMETILSRAGYGKISLLALADTYPDLAVSLWGRHAGSMAYFYALYDLSVISPQDLHQLKANLDTIAVALAARHNIRHTVVFNIQAGITDDNIREIERLNGTNDDFALGPMNHIYYGVDLGKSQILNNAKQPPNLDGSLDKVQAALAASPNEMFHVEHFDAKRVRPVMQAMPLLKHSICSYIIIGINILLFVLMELSGGSADIYTLLRFGAVNYHLVFTFGEYHRLFIPIFLHSGIMHLLFNTMSLILFGIRAERFFGIWKFLVIYIISGVAGNVAMAFSNPIAVGVGASGSIYGVIGALFALTKIRRKNVENLNSSALAIMIVVGVVMGFTMPVAAGGANVANAAHIGGLVTGFGLGWLLTIKSPKQT